MKNHDGKNIKMTGFNDLLKRSLSRCVPMFLFYYFILYCYYNRKSVNILGIDS